jgi:predicted RNase H-like HicB family nuclease
MIWRNGYNRKIFQQKKPLPNLIRSHLSLKTIALIDVPDRPGCISTGNTLEETEANIRKAITLYLDTFREDDLAIPEPSPKGKAIAIQMV